MNDQDVLDMTAIGARLSSARRRAGMTIADVAATTKVSSHYLDAIEREEFGRLPSRVHRLGFTRAFAKAVNLDGDEIIEALRTRLDDRTSSYDLIISGEDEPRPKRSLLEGIASILPLNFNT
jgi:cytoskeletal protein RodZ